MSFDRLDFRNALGRFATGICVITANPKNFEPFGMTINSFASVSLDPPLILWSLQKDSDCVPAFEATEQFAVNVLTQDQLLISQHYARRGHHTLDPEHVYEGSTGLPLLKDSLVNFECEIWQRYEGGDHVILVGKVLTIKAGAVDAQPLVFFSGAYQELQQ